MMIHSVTSLFGLMCSVMTAAVHDVFIPLAMLKDDRVMTTLTAHYSFAVSQVPSVLACSTDWVSVLLP